MNRRTNANHQPKMFADPESGSEARKNDLEKRERKQEKLMGTKI
jgi:hypothetical protein